MPRNKGETQEEYKARQKELLGRIPSRTLDQMPDVDYTYEEEYVNPHTGEVQIVTVKVYPEGTNPNEDIRPAFAYGAK